MKAETLMRIRGVNISNRVLILYHDIEDDHSHDEIRIKFLKY